MAKRGRKKKDEITTEKSLSGVYFSKEQEDAVVRFLLSESEVERNFIYNAYLKFPLEKMTESIINRYKLYSNKMPYKELFDDTLSYLHTKIYMFDPKRKKKSYSYFGTIIKRRLLNNIKKETKEQKKVLLYEDVYRSVANGSDIEEVEYTEENIMVNFFKLITADIKVFLIENEGNESKNTELKVGNAIVEISDNWTKLYSENDTNKYKKNFVLECIRNITMLTTAEISQSLKFYKKFYIEKKKNYLKKIHED